MHRLIPLVLVAWTLLHSISLGQQGEAKKAEELSIFEAARQAVTSFNIREGKVLGFHERQVKFDEVPAEGAVLIGLDVGVGKSGDIDSIYAIRPVYRTAKDDEAPYRERGLFFDLPLGGGKVMKSRVVRIVSLRANPGFAVGGMTVRSGLNFDGLSLLYMKIEGTQLNPGLNYSSAWVGARTGGSEESVDGGGSLVLGVHGSATQEMIRSLGFYFGPPRVAPPVVAPKPIMPPKVEKKAAAAEAPVPAPPAPPDEEDTSSTSAVPAGGGVNWLTYVIFVLVAVVVLAVLLVANRNERASKPVKAVQPAEVMPVSTAASAAVTAQRPLPAVDRADEPWKPEEVAPAPTLDVHKVSKEVAMTMFFIAGMQFLVGLVIASLAPEMIVGQGGKEVAGAMGLGIMVVGIIYVFLGYSAYSQPFLAAAGGLLVYACFTYWDYQARPDMVMNGAIVKLAIAAALVRCVMISAKVMFDLPQARHAGSRRDGELEAPVQELLHQLERERAPASPKPREAVAVKTRSTQAEPMPWWVDMGMWGIKDRSTAWLFCGISVVIAVLPSLLAFRNGNPKLYLANVFLLAALWYWACIKWMDDNDGWATRK